MSLTPYAVTFDARDAKLVATFWAQALDRSLAEGADEIRAVVAADPAVAGSTVISFQQVPEHKERKNRMHFDFVTAGFAAEVDRLTGLGATKLNEVDTTDIHYATFADPEGNEFDVIAA